MKTKIKSIVSVVLTLMMVVSMVTIAFPTINAATIDESSEVAATVDDASEVAATVDGASAVAADTYYLWYNNQGSNNPPYTSSVAMTAEGSNYVATIDVYSGKNFGFLINTSSSSCNSNIVWSSAPTLDKTSDFFDWSGGKYGWYGNQNYAFVEGCATSDFTMKVVYNTSGTVSISKNNGSGGDTADPKDVTPTFVDGQTEVERTIAPKSYYRLNATAQLEGVANSSNYLKYTTTCTPNPTSLTSNTTARPRFRSDSVGTYTLTTTVTNTQNTSLTAVRTTTITVSNDVSPDKYAVYFIDGTQIYMVESPMGSGIYLSESTVPSDTSTAFTLIRGVTSGSTYTLTYAKRSGSNSSDYWFTSSNSSDTVNSSWTSDAPTGLDQSRYRNNMGSSKTVKYDSNTGKISLVDTGVIYAANGTKGGTASLGTTEVTGDDISDADSSYSYVSRYEINEDTEVEIATTIHSDYRSNYYVHAFVINGTDTVLAHNDGNGKYIASYFVEATADVYEIVPIYYRNACANKGEYIKFYVNADNLTGSNSWGNTIACYSYYYKNGSDTSGGTEVADGAYPGQPMLYDDTVNMYYSLIPKKYGTYGISGITINNYCENQDLHKALSGHSTNRQSYDFNDMKYLEELDNDIIRFDVMPGSATNDNQGFADGTYSFDPNTYASTGHNAFKKFTNINGEEIDIFGNVVDSNASVGLYIISSGSYITPGVGQWTTYWNVYRASDKTRIARNIPSNFIRRANDNNNTSEYNTLLSNKALYEGKKVMISYENNKDIDGGNRYDGRWYYTNSKNATFDVTVGYQTSEDGSSWSDTGFDTSYAYIDDGSGVPTTSTNIKIGDNISIIAIPQSDYVFDSFWTADKDGNPISKVNHDTNVISPELSFEMHYIARFVKAAEGTLTISHNKYPTAENGLLGYYKVEARILDADGVQQAKYTQNGIGVNGQRLSVALAYSDNTKDYQLEIKLITTTAGANVFKGWYDATEGNYEPIAGEVGSNSMTWTDKETDETQFVDDPSGKMGELTYTFTTSYSNLFDTTENKLKHSSMPFYSDIGAEKGEYTITYVYTDRFGNQKSYVVTGENDAEYYELHGTFDVVEELVTDKAPYIDDLYKDCQWDLSDFKESSNVTVYAIQPNKRYSVEIFDETGQSDIYNGDDGILFDSYVYKIPVGKTLEQLTDEEKVFYIVPSSRVVKDQGTQEDITEYFQYWQVVDTDIKDDSGEIAGQVTAKCYYPEFYLRIHSNCVITPIYAPLKTDDDEDEEEVEEEIAFISSAQYSREQSTNNDGSTVYDYLYADFIISFMENGGIRLNSDAGKARYKTGIIIEYDTAETLKTNADKKLSDIVGLDDKIESIAKGNVARGTISGTRSYAKFDIDNSVYNDKNRLDYYVKFANTETNQNCIYRAYYYVIDTENDNEIVVSQPIYFYLDKIGTKVCVDDDFYIPED